MKTRIGIIQTVNGKRNGYLEIPSAVLDAMKWKADDIVEIDVNTSGSALVIFRGEDPITVMGGVNEVVNGPQ